MHNRCECGDAPGSANKTNLFVELNGFPYLLAENMDRRGLQQADRSAITSGINVDTSDAMRAVINISINDIGERSDCTPNIIGNNTKVKRLLDVISRNATRLEGQLPVLKSGIIMRVNYQLENQRTRQIMRSMVEDLRITDRSYFVDINRINFNDNSLVVNFNNSMVSTINEFTHGRDRMLIRITNVQMFYESVSERQSVPAIRRSMTAHPYDHPNSHIMPGTNEEYFYHREMQHRHYIGDPPGYDDRRENSMLCPPEWAMFNQFYHFEKDGRRVVLHREEIYDPTRRVNLIPCGTVHVNRSFIINPGHRIIFKFSVWKNDVISILDTLNVAKALKAKFYNCCDHRFPYHQNADGFIVYDQDPTNVDVNAGEFGGYEGDDGFLINTDQHECHHHPRPPKPPHRPDEYNQLISMLYDERRRNEQSEKTINELLDRIKALEDQLNANPDTDEPPITPGDDECDCDHSEINERLDNIDQRLNDEDIDPMPEQVVEQIFQEVVDQTKGEL